ISVGRVILVAPYSGRLSPQFPAHDLRRLSRPLAMTSTLMLSRPLTTAARVASVAVAVSAVLLAGCGKNDEKKAASQTAARVNKEEITVHQINHVLQAQRGLPPEQA